jgi:hypothetical protein
MSRNCELPKQVVAKVMKKADEKKNKEAGQEIIDEIRRANGSGVLKTRSGKEYPRRGGSRSKRGGANSAVVHTICLMIIGMGGAAGYYAGIAAAKSLGFLDTFQTMLDLAKSGVEGCGDVAQGISRAQAAEAMTALGAQPAATGTVACSSAWATLEGAEKDIRRTLTGYGKLAAAAGVGTAGSYYNKLYDFVNNLIDNHGCSGETKTTSTPPSPSPSTTPSTTLGGGRRRRRRRTYKKRKGGGKKRKSHRARKSRRRKSRRRKSRRRKSHRRKSRRHRR